MAVSAVWIRNNMLFSCDRYERQLTEAELKVQRSLQKLSIPDWYLNKRSNPPKILNNATPIESRPPSWKNAGSKKNSTINSTCSNLTDTLPLESPKKNSKTTNNTSTYNISKQPKSPEPKHPKSPSNSSEDEVFDTKIPEVKLSTNISKTFPKVSPSRKIQNINLVFPQGSDMDLSCDLEEEEISKVSKYSTFVLKKHPNSTKKNEKDSSPKTSPKKIKNVLLQTQEVVSTPTKTPNSNVAFKVRAASTPKFTPANLFSSTIIEESPKTKKAVSPNILEKSSIFEDSARNLSTKNSLEDSKPRRLSQSFLEKTFLFEDSSRSEQLSQSFGTPKKVNRFNLLLERNIRSIDPIIFVKEDSSRSSRVREIVKRIEVTKADGPEKKANQKLKNLVKVPEKKINRESKSPVLGVQEKRTNLESQSPCTRFLNSRRKSTDLENVVKSKQIRDKSLIREIIGTLSEKVSRSSFPRQNQANTVNKNFVRLLVNALEKGDKSELEIFSKSLMYEEDPSDSSESEGKSCTTTMSSKDTDSGSDSDQKSPFLRSDNETTRFNYSALITQNPMENNAKPRPDDDSVYWIPVSRCKLPRTSSLISMMSRLSGNGQSPCVSPIRSDGELEQSQPWGATFKKTNTLSRKLFRIDETTVIDSGYSDRSDRSGNGSVTDSTWSEDTQNDSAAEVQANRVKKSRRKSIVANTFKVHC